MTEYKFTDLRELKVSDSGPGTIEGYRASFDIDEGADLILHGAFKDTIPEYLNSGFTAHSHVWQFSEVVGFPLVAYEDAHGFWVKSQFHSTPNAQNVRTIAKERRKAGKQVGFSFGYSPLDFSYMQARDYESELPKYVKADRLSYNMDQAKRFPQIRLLKKLSVIEDSIVTAPMNKLAAATSVKHSYGRGDNLSTGDLIRMRTRSFMLEADSIEAQFGSSCDPYMQAQFLLASSRLRMKCSEFLNGPSAKAHNGRALDSARLQLESMLLRLRALHTLASHR